MVQQIIDVWKLSRSIRNVAIFCSDKFIFWLCPKIRNLRRKIDYLIYDIMVK